MVNTMVAWTLSGGPRTHTYSLFLTNGPLKEIRLASTLFIVTVTCSALSEIDDCSQYLPAQTSVKKYYKAPPSLSKMQSQSYRQSARLIPDYSAEYMASDFSNPTISRFRQP